MIAADVLVPFGVAPGDAKRRDDRTLILLILVRQQQTMAFVIKFPPITCHLSELKNMVAGSIPLLDEPLALLLEGNVQRLEQRGRRIMNAISEGKAKRELIPLAEI